MICRINHLFTHLRSAWGILLQTPMSQIPAHPVRELFIPTFLSARVDLVLVKIYFRGKTACNLIGLLHLQYNDKYASGVQPCFLWLLLCGWKLNRCGSGHAHILWFRKDHLMVILHWPVPAAPWSWAGFCTCSSPDASGCLDVSMPGIILMACTSPSP